MKFLEYLKKLIQYKKKADLGQVPREQVLHVAALYVDLVQAPKPAEFALFLKVMSWVFKGVGPRAAALDLIGQWMESVPACRFVHINPWKIALELAIRVVDPARLNQGATELCGTTGPVYSFMVTDPCGYVRMATSLVSRCRGRLGLMRVRATTWLCNRVVPQRTASVDFVVLSCVRATVPATTFMQGFVESTQPVLLHRWFERMGYAEVQTCMMNVHEQQAAVHRLAFDDSVNLGIKRTVELVRSGVTVVPGTDRPSFEGSHLAELGRAREHLRAAALLLSGGQHVVMMAITPSLADFVLNGTALRHRPGRRMELHWVVIEAMVVGPFDLQVQMVTWGRRAVRKVSVSVFCYNYYGYISAKP